MKDIPQEEKLFIDNECEQQIDQQQQDEYQEDPIEEIIQQNQHFIKKLIGSQNLKYINKQDELKPYNEKKVVRIIQHLTYSFINLHPLLETFNSKQKSKKKKIQHQSIYTEEKENQETNNQSENKVKIKAFKSQYKKRREWSEDEKEKFNQALCEFGNNYSKISEFIGSRSKHQVKSHYQMYCKKKQKI